MEHVLLDRLWIIICTLLVLLMQAGFLCLEAGVTRRKNDINVAMKNITDFAIAVLMFWLVGFHIAYGATANGWWTDWQQWRFVQDNETIIRFLFRVMFCTTAVTIVSGAVAERMRFWSYLLLSAIVSSLIYPVFVHWSWGEAGWLRQLGFVDFAGSTVVHSLGGWVALAAVLFIGPREGRFNATGRLHDFPGSDTTRSILGGMLLWVGWLGFNGGSTLAFDDRVPIVLINTLLGGAGGFIVPLGLAWKRGGAVQAKWLVNGGLAGLVSVTAACNLITPSVAVLVGAIGGLVMLAIERLMRYHKIDDAVSAIPVHLGAGIWGTLCVGLYGRPDSSITSTSPVAQLSLQLLGIAVCGLWAMGTTFVALKVMRRFLSLRVTPEEERMGLNVAEHGARTDLNDLLKVMADHQEAKNLHIRAPAEPFTEVGQIAHCYNQTIAALEDATSRTQAIINTALEAIITADLDTLTVTSANPAAEQMFERRSSDIIGLPLIELFAADVFGHRLPFIPGVEEIDPEEKRRRNASLHAILDSWHARNTPIEVRGQCASGRIFPIELCVSLISTSAGAILVASARDISLRKQDEAELRDAAVEASQKNVQLQHALTTLHKTQTRLINSEKIAALGRMVGGVAHEINNPINFIYGNIHHVQKYVDDLLDAITLYQSYLPDPEDALQDAINDLDLDFLQSDLPSLLLSMRSGAERIRLIVESLRTFARLDEADLKRIDINASLDSALLLLEYSFSQHEIRVVRNYGQLPNVECFAAHINQVFFNILVNAIDALEAVASDRTALVLDISTQHRSDGMVAITLLDNGQGMSPTQVDRAFEPLFTTKPIGKGTGLGLAISYQIIVDEHNGQLELESERNDHTRLTITIPTQQSNIAPLPLSAS